MKRSLFLLVAYILTNPPTLPAQEPAPQAAFLNVVNLVALREPTTIQLGGFALNGGEPMPAGEISGLLAILPGNHSLTLTNPGAKPREFALPLVLEAGKTVAVICYEEIKEYRDGSREAKLRCSVLVEGDKAGPRLSIVSLLHDPLVGISLSGKEVTLSTREAHQAPVKLEDSITVVHRGRTLAEFEIAKPIHYLGFLFESPESREVGFSLIQNEKLEYQAPLADDDEEKEKAE
ncbi:MAG: hypothetical protein QE273_18600 [Verrucomicrobiales bacterium]|nr:hypothetical protein [Verrucomicrobiales bacterium]